MLSISVLFFLASAQSIEVKAPKDDLSPILQSTESGKTSSEDSFVELPNVNFAGGSNRTRFLQIRGQGETSVYETTPSHSVGFWIEDIDVTGLLAVWPQLNLKTLTLKSGPQSVEEGGFSSAGALKMELQDATTPLAQAVTGSAQEYQLSLQTQPLPQSQFFIFHRRSNGFFENSFTQQPGAQQNEVSSSWTQKWIRSAKTQIQSAHLLQSQKNLYDVWSTNNSYVTQSDRQGEDALNVHGHSLKIHNQWTPTTSVDLLSSFTQAQSIYSYDADWGHSADYDYFDFQKRQRQQWHQKLFFNFKTLSLGAHLSGLSEQSQLQNYKKGLLKNALNSDFTSSNVAAIAQNKWSLGLNELSVAFRNEWQNLRYNDSNSLTQQRSLQAQATSAQWSRPLLEDSLGALRWSRGFKNSGFNTDPDLRSEDLYYGPARIEALEAELSSNQSRLVLFYQKQDNAHVKISQQSDPNDPSTFLYRTTNSGRTDSWGLEGWQKWTLHRWTFETQVGLLKTQFRDYSFENISYRGRDLAHAPRWNYATSVRYDWSPNPTRGWSSVLNINGRDGFFYSNNHQQKSSAYTLLNMGILYQHKKWDVAFWLKNMANTRTTVRGFYFANEPPDWPVKLYEQLGPPRHFLLTTNYRF